MQHTDLVKSLEDPNTYLVSSSGDPLQQSLSGLLLDGLPPSASAAFLPKTGNNLEVYHLWLQRGHSHDACPGDLHPWRRVSRSYACTAGHWLLLKTDLSVQLHNAVISCRKPSLGLSCVIGLRDALQILHVALGRRMLPVCVQASRMAQESCRRCGRVSRA